MSTAADEQAWLDALREVLDTTVRLVLPCYQVDRLDPAPGSQAAAELHSTERNAEDQPWGERPVRTALVAAKMSCLIAASQAQAISQLLRASPSSSPVEVLSRAVIEAASQALWLLEPRLGARRRVARLQALRLASAVEARRTAVALGTGQEPSGYSETEDKVRAYSKYLGIAEPVLERVKGRRGPVAVCEGEAVPGYTERAKVLLDLFDDASAYNLYAGVAHGKLYALWRAFRPSGAVVGGQPWYGLESDPRLLHAAVDGVRGALIAPALASLGLFGWGPGELGTWCERSDDQMARLDPAT